MSLTTATDLVVWQPLMV